MTVWLWLNQPNSAGKHSFSGNDKAVSLRDSIAQVGCLSGNRHHERTPSTRTQQEPNLALFFSWSFSRIEVLAHRETSMFIALQLSWHNPENVDEMYVKRHNAWHSGSQTWRGFWYKRRDRFANPLLPLVNPFARFGNYNLC